MTFSFLGPRKPKFFVANTPDASPNCSSSSMEMFPEDISTIDTDSEEGDSTVTLANKIAGKRHVSTFKFRSLSELNKDQKICICPSPTSSPIPLPSPEVFEISSDEELENSMCELEAKISLEMSDDSF